MLIVKKSASILLSLLLGLVFLYSAYSKLDPVIETFEFTFVDLGVANWYTAPVIARLLIGFEFLTGLLLIFSYRLKTFTIPLTIGVLGFFILYLLIQIFISGNAGNCGCFGERLHMTPMQAIVKNLVMIALCIPLFIWNFSWTWRSKLLFPFLLSPFCFIVPFVINPIDYKYSSNNFEEVVNYPLDLDLLYHPEDTAKVEIPKIELRKGKQVVAFLSLTCSHCRIAAKKFRLIKKENPELPIYFVLNGDRSILSEFMEDTQSANIPHSFCLGKSFAVLSSAHLPRIYYLNDGIVLKKLDYFELNQYQIEDWIKTGNLP